MNKIEQHYQDNQTSPGEIEEKIEETRHRMDRTLDRLSEKLQVSNYLDDAESWVKEQVNDIDARELLRKTRKLGRNAAEGARNHPVGVTLAGLALASFLIPKKAIPEKASEKTRDMVDKTREKVSDTASEFEETLSSSVEKARERLAGNDAIQSTHDALAKGPEEAPVLMGLCALSLGFLAGISFPSTRRERELCGEPSRELRRQVRGKGEELLSRGKEDLENARNELEKLKEDARIKAERVAHRSARELEHSLERT